MKTAVFRVVLIGALALTHSLFAQERKALLIGNADYEGELALRNPANDVEDLSKALSSLGFQVTTLKNLELGAMERGVLEFNRSLKKGDVALFFYAGHGMEVEGANYLIPLKATIREAFEVKRQALEVGYVLDALEASDANLKVVVLDCCRDNPMKRSWTRSKAGKGLAAITAPEGTIIAFSTAPNTVALDGKGRNSPYAEHLIQTMQSRPTGGLELIQLFLTASRGVKKAYGQTPWVSLEASLDPYYLTGGPQTLVMPRNPDMAPLQGDSSPRSATEEKPFVNSLGMKFVPVPGTDVLFCIWETRVQDFAAFIQESGYDYELGETPHTLDTNGWEQREGEGHSWRNPGFTQNDDHPVTCVSWEDAQEFCNWLSEKEGVKYRLPTDREWSMAVGIGDRENASVSPIDKDEKIPDVYPWGGSFPPPSMAANYSGSEARTSTWPSNFSVIEDFKDNHARTAPVGSYMADGLGLFDLGGNVYEWCEDWFDKSVPTFRVLRGGSWTGLTSKNLLSSGRHIAMPAERNDSYGFRCVLAVGSGG